MPKDKIKHNTFSSVYVMSIACKHNTAAGWTQTRQFTCRLFWCTSRPSMCVCGMWICDQEECTNAAVRRWGGEASRLQNRLHHEGPEGRRSSRLFSFCVRLFLAARLTLDFFIAKRCTYTRKFRIVVERPPPDAFEFSAFGRREEFSAVAFASEAPHG